MEIALPLRGGIEMVGKANAAVVEYKWFLKLFGYVYLRSLHAQAGIREEKSAEFRFEHQTEEKQSD